MHGNMVLQVIGFATVVYWAIVFVLACFDTVQEIKAEERQSLSKGNKEDAGTEPK